MERRDTENFNPGNGGPGAGGGASPDSLNQVFARAVDHHRKGRLRESETELSKIQGLQPDIPEVLHLLSMIMLQTDRPDEAIVYLEKVIAVVPESADLFNLLGSAFNLVGRPADALAANERCAALSPENAEAHYNLGVRLEKLARWKDAAASYQRAVDLFPDFLDAHHNLGLAMKKSGLLEQAAGALRGSIGDDPGDAEAICRLGNVVHLMGQPDEAEKQYRRAIELNPGFGRAHYQLGSLYRQAGDLTSAISCYGDMLERDPRFAEIAFHSDRNLDGIAEYVRSRPAELRNLQALRVFHASSLEEHCAQSKTEFKVLVKLKVHPIESDQPVVGYDLFLAELKDGGVLGGSNLPATRSGAFFSRQLIHNEWRLMTDPVYQKREQVVLGSEKQIVIPVFEEKEYSGPHLLLGSHGNFGHWLLNNFSRLMLIRDDETLKSLPVVVGSELSGARLECLARIGCGEDRIVRVPPGQIAWFERLWVPSFPFFAEPKILMWAPETVHFIRSVLGVPPERRKNNAPRRLFLTRRNAKWRQLKDEDKIFAAIQPFGFECIDPAGLSLDEQITLASEAEIIMGPFGAAMNLHLFAPSGTHVVELKLPEPGMDIHPTLAREIGQVHHNIICERESSSGYRLNDNLVAPFDEVVALAKTLSGHA